MTIAPVREASYLLTRRVLSFWWRWIAADAFARKAIKGQLLEPEWSALERLENNLRVCGAVEAWFEYRSQNSAEQRVRRGILSTLLSGLTVAGEAVPDLVRVCKPEDTAAEVLKDALRKHLNALQPTPARSALPAPTPAISAAPGNKSPRQDYRGAAIILPAADPFENQEMEAMHGTNGTALREAASVELRLPPPIQITKPTGEGLTEMLELLVVKWNLDLTQELGAETYQRLAGETGSCVNTIRFHIQGIRRDRGIRVNAPVDLSGVQPLDLPDHLTNIERAEAAAEHLGVDVTQELAPGVADRLAIVAGLDGSQIRTALGKLRARRRVPSAAARPTPAHQPPAADQPLALPPDFTNTQRVAAAADHLKLNLRRVLTKEITNQLALLAGLDREAVRPALEKVRKERGMQTGYGSTSRGRKSPTISVPEKSIPSTDKKPETDINSISETPPLPASNDRAKSLFLDIAAELVGVAKAGEGDRVALLLKAAELAERSL